MNKTINQNLNVQLSELINFRFEQRVKREMEKFPNLGMDEIIRLEEIKMEKDYKETYELIQELRQTQ